jgi:hypothetical protein
VTAVPITEYAEPVTVPAIYGVTPWLGPATTPPLHLVETYSGWWVEPTDEGVSEHTTIVRELTGLVGSRYWLGGPGVLEPIAGDVIVSGDGITLTEPVTGIFGFGDDLLDALSDFRSALHEHLDVLTAQDELGADLKKQLAFLQQHLRQV